MTTILAESRQPADSLIEWLAEEALANSAPDRLFEGCCRRLRALGLPLLRGHVAFRILHPLHAAQTMTWTEAGLAQEEISADALNSSAWLTSPSYHLVANHLPFLRRRLTGPDARLDFPILKDFAARGGTDYLCCLVGFDPSSDRGLLSSWLGGRPGGFTESEIALLRKVARHLGIAFKSRIERNIAQNVAAAYLGKAAGTAVLTGSIRRGDGQKIEAVLWYSDLRRSTALADRLPAEAFLQLLNGYFEASAGAVVEAGGEVVSLVGDAVLGLFRAGGAPAESCAAALAAAGEARRRLAGLPPGPDGRPLDFGIGLHLGPVIHGNIGIAERLQFTLVGAAVNEVVRVQELTKELTTPVLATAAFARHLPRPWRPLGRHVLRGLDQPMEILAPAG